VPAFLERHAPLTPESKSGGWPAASTIGVLFDREGLTTKRELRRRSPPSTAPFAHCGSANDVWCIDFKGWFTTGDGVRCEPLTLTDAHSRYLWTVRRWLGATPSTSGRCSTPPSANSACRLGCAPTTVRHCVTHVVGQICYLCSRLLSLTWKIVQR
jgi:hypothetical protein